MAIAGKGDEIVDGRILSLFKNFGEQLARKH